MTYWFIAEGNLQNEFAVHAVAVKSQPRAQCRSPEPTSSSIFGEKRKIHRLASPRSTYLPPKRRFRRLGLQRSDLHLRDQILQTSGLRGYSGSC
jgi:hypothetical protein